MGHGSIVFFDAQGFVDFVKRHGSQAEKVFEVFQNHTSENEYRRYNTELTIPFDIYQAHVKVLDAVLTATYSTKPLVPPRWSHAYGRRIARSESKKSEVVDFLKEMDVKPENLAPLKKVSLDELQQLIDNSSEDEETVIDDKRLVSKRKKNQLLFKTNGKDGINEILLTLTKDGSRIQYNFSADWTEEWRRREEAAQDIIHKAGFAIYRGQL